LALGPAPRILAQQDESAFLILAVLVVVYAVLFSISKANLEVIARTAPRPEEKLCLWSRPFLRTTKIYVEHV
jgi:hypothetical protein